MAGFLRDVIVLGVITMVTTLICTARSDDVIRPVRQSHNKPRKWTNNVIPYVMTHSVTDSYEQLLIEAMREIESNTGTKDSPCITFRPATPSDYNYMNLEYNQRRPSCHATVGMGGHGIDGRETIVGLHTYCKPIGTILHQLMHALGFQHEHQRPDRDSYIDVHSDNVRPGLLRNFHVLDVEEVHLEGTDYDFKSVLQYGPFHFAKSPMQPAMTPKAGQIAKGVRMGRARYMSVSDVTRVQRLYQCAADLSHIKQRDPADVMIDCDFENGDLCQLKQETQDDYDWTIGQDNVGAAGIIRDYTRGNGKYIYARTDGTVGHVARLNSSQFPKGKYCLVYALYTYGNQTSNFQAIVKTAQGEDAGSTPRQGHGFWVIQRRDIDVSEPWSLVLEYKVGGEKNVDVAVDDVEVLKGECGDRV